MYAEERAQHFIQNRTDDAPPPMSRLSPLGVGVEVVRDEIKWHMKWLLERSSMSECERLTAVLQTTM